MKHLSKGAVTIVKLQMWRLQDTMEISTEIKYIEISTFVSSNSRFDFPFWDRWSKI